MKRKNKLNGFITPGSPEDIELKRKKKFIEQKKRQREEEVIGNSWGKTDLYVLDSESSKVFEYLVLETLGRADYIDEIMFASDFEDLCRGTDLFIKPKSSDPASESEWVAVDVTTNTDKFIEVNSSKNPETNAPILTEFLKERGYKLTHGDRVARRILYLDRMDLRYFLYQFIQEFSRNKNKFVELLSENNGNIKSVVDYLLEEGFGLSFFEDYENPPFKLSNEEAEKEISPDNPKIEEVVKKKRRRISEIRAN